MEDAIKAEGNFGGGGVSCKGLVVPQRPCFFSGKRGEWGLEVSEEFTLGELSGSSRATQWPFSTERFPVVSQLPSLSLLCSQAFAPSLCGGGEGGSDRARLSRLQILGEEFQALCSGMMPGVIIDQEVTLGLEHQNRGLESTDGGRGSGFGPKSGLLLRERHQAWD